MTLSSVLVLVLDLPLSLSLAALSRGFLLDPAGPATLSSPSLLAVSLSLSPHVLVLVPVPMFVLSRLLVMLLLLSHSFFCSDCLSLVFDPDLSRPTRRQLGKGAQLASARDDAAEFQRCRVACVSLDPAGRDRLDAIATLRRAFSSSALHVAHPRALPLAILERFPVRSGYHTSSLPSSLPNPALRLSSFTVPASSCASRAPAHRGSRAIWVSRRAPVHHIRASTNLIHPRSPSHALRTIGHCRDMLRHVSRRLHRAPAPAATHSIRAREHRASAHLPMYSVWRSALPLQSGPSTNPTEAYTNGRGAESVVSLLDGGDAGHMDDINMHAARKAYWAMTEPRRPRARDAGALRDGSAPWDGRGRAHLRLQDVSLLPNLRHPLLSLIVPLLSPADKQKFPYVQTY
ncbi:hypothetical protein DFH09DRAFT_1444899 [Mycena vulgaris]|nr:hypothetical protein DFH09DRAFT_1444899 [Mycena vulgaris]